MSCGKTRLCWNQISDGFVLKMSGLNGGDDVREVESVLLSRSG